MWPAKQKNIVPTYKAAAAEFYIWLYRVRLFFLQNLGKWDQLFDKKLNFIWVGVALLPCRVYITVLYTNPLRQKYTAGPAEAVQSWSG